jgi:hypothetical protein
MLNAANNGSSQSGYELTTGTIKVPSKTLGTEYVFNK